MPGGDRTGPLGQGPMTGRAAGFCAGNQEPGYASPGFGRRSFRGRGRGFGRGFWGRGRGFWSQRPYPEPNYEMSYPRPSKDEEKKYLEDMLKNLEEDIKDIKNRIKELSE